VLLAGQQVREFLLAPYLAKAHRIGAVRIVFPYEQRNRRADLNAFAVELGGEGARVGFAFRGDFAGFVFVAVQVIDPDSVEDFEIALA
jgi:hypothetical protein